MAGILRSLAGVGLFALVLATEAGLAQQPAATPAPPPQQPQTAGNPAPQAQDQQPPIFRAGINFVRVDVIVTDKNGNPVNDLKPGDFEIIEQKAPQKIETFKLISLDGGLAPGPDGPPREIRTDADEEAEAAREDVRLFAFFLDDYHVQRGASMAARNQLARFVETQLGPSDMIGMMYPLQPIDSVRMTRNHEAIAKGLQQFMGRKYDYTPRNPIEEKYAYYPTEMVEKIRNQVSMSALKSLIVHMGGLKEGRKALILVSEGYSSLLPPQMRNPIASMPGLGNPSSGDPDAGVGNPLEDRARFSADMDMESDLRSIWDLANRNNTAIYAVDPRGLATNEFGIDQNVGLQQDRASLNASLETLRTLALSTDGRAIVNRNDLTIGMKQIVRDTSAYYLLGYNSTFTATDGKFHEIKVNVKRPGVQVRARKGYWAFTADDAARAMAPSKPEMPNAYSTALASIAPQARGARVVRTWIGTERAANGKTKVTFVWEPMPKSPGEPARPGDAPARVSLMAVGPDGAPYFRGKIPDAAASTTAVAAAQKVSFEAAPGKMQMRVSVEGANADVLDSETREVDVPDLTKPETALGTPGVFRARTVRELQQLKADVQATPTASREFSRTDRVFIRVTSYAPGATTPVVTAKLLNRAGQPMGDLAVAPVNGSEPGTSDVDLALAAMPAGEYLVEITATADGAPAKEVVGFRITG
jgi:VWFA-related protein